MDLKTVITDKLLELSEQLSKYNELRRFGLSEDKAFESIIEGKKKTLEDLLKVITDGRK